jgi:hypothetical protein
MMKTRRDQSGSGALRAQRAALAAGIGALALAAGCGPSEVVETRRVYEQRRVEAPPPVTDILITDLREGPSASPTQERVVGTIINRGDKAVSQLSIKVDALDQAGRVVQTITTPPLDQTIAPLGGQATFEAFIPRDPAITTYHAVAIAR